MTDPERHLFIRHLLASVKCAVCQHQYGPEDIDVIEQHDELWILSVVCSDCETQGLIFAIIREVTSDSLPLLDMVEEEEPDALEHLPSIDADEVLDMHRLLREFDGDVYELLAQCN